MANYIKDTAIQENSISETKLDSSLQSWKETVTNHINNNDNPHNITKSSIGLDNVTNDAQVKRSELGVANGVATLDSTGKVPSGQLPSYVDDVIEGYLYNGVFYKDTSYTTSIVGESGKIYIDLPTNKTYRWTGSVYGVISETIALGEISSTAYRGDRGKIAYDHSQSAHAPSNAQANVIETIKVNGTALTPNSKAVDITIPTVGNGTITIKQGGTSKGTFTTNQNGNTTIELTDTNTTYTAGDGLSLSGTTFSNNGVRSIATGTTNGTISVNTNGNISNIGVYGLKSAAYTNSSDYAAASHTHSQYLTGITKAMVEGVLTGNITSHTHSYIPLADKGLSNGKVPYYVEFPNNQNLVNLGYNEESTKNNDEAYLKGLCKWAIDNFSNKGFILLIGNAQPGSVGYCCIQLYSNNGKDANTGLPRYCSGTYISLDRATTNFACKDYIWTWGGSFNGIASSSSKWANPRTITLTGSVTGSVSIDGSGDVSLATTTNHTHTFDSLTSKPTTISGYGITDALTNKYITYKQDFQRYVILLCQIGANSTNQSHTINGTFWANSGGVNRYQAAYINVHCSDWTSNHNEYYGFTPFGLGTKCRLVTCTYQSSQYLAITFENTQATYIYFDGSYSNILFTPILYYTSNTGTIENSEIYNSISEVTYNKIPLISSAETALTSANYNSYAPKLDGTGASGTWGINISGNAAKATKLTSTTVSPFDSTSSKYRKFASVNITNRYLGKQALLLLNVSLTAASRGNSCKVYVMAYQQNALGNPPYYSVETDCDNRNFEIYAVLNYTSTTSTIELYAYGKGLNYHSLTVSLLSGTNIIDIGSDILSSLPSGTVITPTKYGSVYSATKLQNSRTIWGQSFDGTGNVSGVLSDVNQVTFDANKTYGIFRGDWYDSALTRDDLAFSVPRAVFGGNVGIGTTSPACKLDVEGDIRASKTLSSSSIELNGALPYIDFHYDGATDDYTTRIIEGVSGELTLIGKLRIGSNYTATNVYTFHVASGDSFFDDNVITGSDFSSRGNAIIDGTVSCTKLLQTSDIKYKTNIKQIKYEEALKIIENLNPVTWDWNENTIVTGSSSGFVAQEAEEFIPNAISRDNENNLSLDYTQLHSYEIRVIQEQQKEIKDLKQRLEVLENLVLQLTNREI